MEQGVLDILNLIPFGALGTTNDDGSSSVVPLHFATDERNLYWFSMPDSAHSKNMAHNPAISFAVWTPDRMPNLRGVCINTVGRKVDSEYEKEHGRTTFTMKYPEIPDAFNEYDMYTAPIGEIDWNRSADNKWYLNGRILGETRID